jgi:Glycosyl transferases group 1
LDKHLHIISLDVPWPADYGGVIEIFYKLRALHQQGIKIHLHCFTKSRNPQKELAKYCVEVNYYTRKKNLAGFSLTLPYIVNSRNNPELLINLQKDNYPVLLEGIHCTYLLNSAQLENRKVFIRLHNTEYLYYKNLAKHETNILKKMYFLHESRLLKKYEQAIANKAMIFAMSDIDVTQYKNDFAATQIQYLPGFINWTMAAGKEGKGCYCLYHGNLSINENETAVIWLLKNVFNNLDIPFVIAGKKPSKKLLALAHQHKNTCIVANPGENEMQDIIAKAQLHVLPSFNNTGIKLKLLNALFNGRHCLVNQAAVAGSRLEAACHIANDATSFKKAIEAIYQQPFTEHEKEKRQGLLQTIYNNEANAKWLANSFGY